MGYKMVQNPPFSYLQVTEFRQNRGFESLTAHHKPLILLSRFQQWAGQRADTRNASASLIEEIGLPLLPALRRKESPLSPAWPHHNQAYSPLAVDELHSM